LPPCVCPRQALQSGAIWHDVQVYLSPFHLSVLAMQSIDVPTVGGTIAVNAHGMDHRIGGIAPTIKSMRLMLADGSVLNMSKQENEELFRAVIGGYGLLGVILDVELELMDNLFYKEDQKIITSQDFLQEFKRIIEHKNIHMFYARLSTAPSSFLKEMVLYTFEVTQPKTGEPAHLTSESYVKFRRLVLNLGRKNHIGREIKWWGEKYIQPKLQSNASSRNQIMHRSYAYLKNNITNNTDVLQEFFLPKEKVIDFIKELGAVLEKQGVITRNVEIRCVYKEDLLLDYAHGDWFGVVLYLNFNVDEVEKIMTVHSNLIDISQKFGGSFYLPYLLSASKEQLKKSYPNFEKFLKFKQKYDPNELFTSEFYKKYK
jgi:FAD/FMN-containing dehydrogenase